MAGDAAAEWLARLVPLIERDELHRVAIVMGSGAARTLVDAAAMLRIRASLAERYVAASPCPVLSAMALADPAVIGFKKPKDEAAEIEVRDPPLLFRKAPRSIATRSAAPLLAVQYLALNVNGTACRKWASLTWLDAWETTAGVPSRAGPSNPALVARGPAMRRWEAAIDTIDLALRPWHVFALLAALPPRKDEPVSDAALYELAVQFDIICTATSGQLKDETAGDARTQLEALALSARAQRWHPPMAFEADDNILPRQKGHLLPNPKVLIKHLSRKAQQALGEAGVADDALLEMVASEAISKVKRGPARRVTVHAIQAASEAFRAVTGTSGWTGQWSHYPCPAIDFWQATARLYGMAPTAEQFIEVVAGKNRRRRK